MLILSQLICILTYITLITAHSHRGIKLNDGNRIPRIGFGTLGKISEIESVGSAVVTAVEAGYRLIDTANIYKNEKLIGKAIRNVISRGIVKRKDLFISTKLSIYSGRAAVVPAIKKSLAELKLKYVDLYVLSLPRNQTTKEDYPYLDIWKGMEDAKRLGLTKSIGVANFNCSNINKILSNCMIRPAVNQIELSCSREDKMKVSISKLIIYFQLFIRGWRISNTWDPLIFNARSHVYEHTMRSHDTVNPTKADMELVSYCQSENIQVMSYAPFGFAVPRPFNDQKLPPSFDNPTIVKIANKYDKSPSHVFLRYLIDRATIPMPKSTNKTHIRSNIDVFNFRLTYKEVYKISEFDIDTAVYLQNGVYTEEASHYIYGKSIQEVYDSQM